MGHLLIRNSTQSQIFTFSFLAVPHNLTLALANFSSQHHEAFLDTSVKCIHVRVCEGWMTSSCKWENHVFGQGINEHYMPIKSRGSIPSMDEYLKITEEISRIQVGVLCYKIKSYYAHPYSGAPGKTKPG